MSIYSKQALIDSPQDHTFLFFWGHQNKNNSVNKSCLSQWYPANFIVDGVQYLSAEQFMMASKAMLFDDTESWNQILHATDQPTIKALGRRVHGYDETIWCANREQIVYHANLAKFSQNSQLMEYLLSTQESILVEASPVDFIWGIGLSQDMPEACDAQQWPGLNLLGFALMRVRESLKKLSPLTK